MFSNPHFISGDVDASIQQLDKILVYGRRVVDLSFYLFSAADVVASSVRGPEVNAEMVEFVN